MPLGAPALTSHPRLQVVPGTSRDLARAGGGRRRRPERFRKVEHRGRGRVGGGLADPVRAPRREARRRAVRRRPGSESRRALRGRARVRQRGRELAGTRLQRGLDSAPARARRGGAVPRQQDSCAQDRPRGAARRRGARVRDALDRRPGQGRAGARLEAGGPAGVRRGSCRARQVQAPKASCRAETRARRTPGRTRTRRRGRGSEAVAAAGPPGHGGRTGREARGRDRGPGRASCGARPGRRRTPPQRGRGPPRRRGTLPARRPVSARRAPRRSHAGGGGALGCRRSP